MYKVIDTRILFRMPHGSPYSNYNHIIIILNSFFSERMPQVQILSQIYLMFPILHRIGDNLRREMYGSLQVMTFGDPVEKRSWFLRCSE